MDNLITNSASKTLSDLKSLVDNLLLLLSDKEKFVVTKRFNLDGTRRHTLEEIGKEFSVTRERVRQIEKNALSKMRRNVFNTSLKDLYAFVSDVVRQHGGLVREDKLQIAMRDSLLPVDSNNFDENRVHLSVVLNDAVECIGNTINFYPYIKEKNVSENAIKVASENIINQLQKHGDVKKLEHLYGELSDLFKSINFDLNKAKSLIPIDKRLTLLDDDLVGLMEWRHIHPRTLRDKILFILRNQKKPLHFSEISKLISAKSFDNKQVNVQAVHNELIRHDQFVLIGRGIYALSEWGYEKGTVSEVIAGILKEKVELDQDEIIDLVFKKRQVKKITIILALKNTNKFERVGRKRYRLKA